ASPDHLSGPRAAWADADLCCYTRARPHPGGGRTLHPLRSTIPAISARVTAAVVPIVRRLVPVVRGGLVQVENARRVVLVLRTQGAGELVVAVCLRVDRKSTRLNSSH